MPEVDSKVYSIPDLLGSGVEVTKVDQRTKILGILAWVLIALGIVIVLVVLFSNNRRGGPRNRNVGRKRYHRRSSRTGKKRLLDDKYYRGKYGRYR